MIVFVLCLFRARAGRYLSRRDSRQSVGSVAVLLAQTAEDKKMLFAMVSDGW